MQVPPLYVGPIPKMAGHIRVSPNRIENVGKSVLE